MTQYGDGVLEGAVQVCQFALLLPLLALAFLLLLAEWLPHTAARGCTFCRITRTFNISCVQGVSLCFGTQTVPLKKVLVPLTHNSLLLRL